VRWRGEVEALTIGASIRATREARGMSQSKLAKDAGLSRQAIAKIEESEGQSLGVDTLCALAGALGVNPAELLGVKEAEGYDPVTQDAAALLRAMPLERRTQARDMVRVMAFSGAMNRAARSALLV